MEFWLDEQMDVKSYRIAKVGSSKALVVNIVPFNCYSYTQLKPICFDRIWNSDFDVVVVPSASVMARVLSHRGTRLNAIKERLHHAHSISYTHGKPLVYASVRCSGCQKSEQIVPAESISNLTKNMRFF